jgi:hypothetical protein
MISNISSSDQTMEIKHMDFLREIFCPNVEYNCFITGETHNGIPELLSNWSQFCIAFTRVEVSSNHMNYVDSNLEVFVHAASIVNVQLSKETLHAFFPKIVDSPYEETLCGLNVRLPAKHRFIFAEDGKCISWKTSFEFVTGFAEALGSCENALTLLSQSVLQQFTVKI